VIEVGAAEPNQRGDFRVIVWQRVLSPASAGTTFRSVCWTGLPSRTTKAGKQRHDNASRSRPVANGWSRWTAVVSTRSSTEGGLGPAVHVNGAPSDPPT